MKISLRQAAINDAKKLYEWRNDPLTRQSSFNTKEISWDEHLSWLTKTLEDIDKTVLIAEDSAKNNIGVVRFYMEGKQAEIHITLNPIYRGKKLSSYILSLACNWLYNNKTITHFTAKIKKDNIASLRAFTKAGFHQTNIDNNIIHLETILNHPDYEQNEYEKVRKKGTQAFVTATRRDEYWNALKEEKTRLIDPVSGRIYSNLLQHIDCCICGKNNSSLVFVKDGLNFVKCSGCGILYTNPCLDEEKLLKHYGSSKSKDLWVEILKTPSQFYYDQRKFNNFLQELSAFTKPGRLLDVGCSLGTFLSIAENAGWETEGLELNKKAVQYATETSKLKVKQLTLNEASYSDKYFRVITFWEVLEHVINPKAILKETYRILENSGILGIMVPNKNSLAMRIMRSSSSAFELGHIWYHSPDTLTSLLQQCGFSTLKIGTQLTELDTILNYLSYNDPYNTPKDASEQIFTEKMVRELSKLIDENLMGYKLYGFFVKAAPLLAAPLLQFNYK